MTYDDWKKAALAAIEVALVRWTKVASGKDDDGRCELCVVFPGCEACPVALVYDKNCKGTSIKQIVAHNKRKKSSGMSQAAAMREPEARKYASQIVSQLLQIRAEVENGKAKP
ncbi:MAG: hypothetical protein JSV86_17145 [Gemmatimonadota bacterium]|nr:MAG: hypothetical protein JSV86_17145 [Gemmatimonadota bacterium]